MQSLSALALGGSASRTGEFVKAPCLVVPAVQPGFGKQTTHRQRLLDIGFGKHVPTQRTYHDVLTARQQIVHTRGAQHAVIPHATDKVARARCLSLLHGRHTVAGASKQTTQLSPACGSGQV
jgi:hypothetical protein